MKFTNFFRLSWIIQLLVGVGLFSVSFYIENQVLQTFLSVPLLAFCLAFSLELGKAVAIVWHRYMSMESGMYPSTTRFISGFFRIGLVILSLICSLLFMADKLDRPQLEQVRDSELHILQERLDGELTRLEARRQERVDAMRMAQQKELKDVQSPRRARISELEIELVKEMNNVINGVFKGPRYQEFERLLEKEQAALAAEMASLSQRHIKQARLLNQSIQTDIDHARQTAIKGANLERQALLEKDYAQDDRANDSRIVSFLQVMQSVFRWDTEPLQFVFIFSVLLSVLMEIGILLAFDTITVSMMPALKAQHKANVATEVLKAKIAEEAKSEEVKHESEMDRVKARANRTMKQAESVLDEFIDQVA